MSSHVVIKQILFCELGRDETGSGVGHAVLVKPVDAFTCHAQQV